MSENKLVRFVLDEDYVIKDYIIEKVSRNFYGYLKEHNASYLINGLYVHSYEKGKSGDELVIIYEEDAQEGIPSYKDLEICYENDNYLIINKPPHLLTIPSTNEPNDSVYNRVLGMGYGCYFVNRLDKETSGLILIAKNKFARIMLKDVTKKYMAITDKPLNPESGRIVANIKKEDIGIKRFVSDEGQLAITNYQLIRQENDLFYYDINLETGRTHQIRVHFAHLGSPLINDELYGKNLGNNELGLICYFMEFVDPFLNNRITKRI